MASKLKIVAMPTIRSTPWSRLADALRRLVSGIGSRPQQSAPAIEQQAAPAPARSIVYPSTGGLTNRDWQYTRGSDLRTVMGASIFAEGRKQ